MLRNLLFLAMFLVFSINILHAQYDISRFQKQHKMKFKKKELKSIEEMLVRALESDDSRMIASASQTLRQYEQIFPNYPFNSFSTV